MILLIDLGNTRLKWALVNENAKDIQQPFEAEGSINKDQAINIVALCSQNNWQMTHVVCSSVIDHSITQSLELAFKKSFPTTIWKKLDGTALINTIGTDYADPAQLGSDRRAMLIAAQALHPNKNLLILGAGTATTIDLLSASAHHLGGWILPGLTLMKNSLANGTDRLGSSCSAFKEMSDLNIGINSQDAIDHGVLMSQLGALELAQAYAHQKNMSLDMIVATGGNAQQLINYQEQEIPTQLIDNLVLRGLLIWHQNHHA